MTFDRNAICRRSKKLKGSSSQRDICRKEPEIVEAVVEGTRLGIGECQYQLRYSKWNCSTVQNSVGKVLKQGKYPLPFPPPYPKIHSNTIFIPRPSSYTNPRYHKCKPAFLLRRIEILQSRVHFELKLLIDIPTSFKSTHFEAWFDSLIPVIYSLRIFLTN